MTPEDVAALVREDMRDLRDPRVHSHIESLLVVPPRPITLLSLFEKPVEPVPGLLVLEHPASATGIVYCEHGSGPADPWRMVSTEREHPPALVPGGDRWARFLDVYFESKVPCELNIWRVRRHSPGCGAGWLTGELPWEEAWGRVMALRQSDPDTPYDCDHAIPY